MVALDTNILVRLTQDDDPAQVMQARNLLAANMVFIPISVALELEWVLRRVYRHPRAAILDAFAILSGMEQVTFERADAVSAALSNMAEGMDFADALHLALAGQCEWMATFDKPFVRLAHAMVPPVRHP